MVGELFLRYILINYGFLVSPNGWQGFITRWPSSHGAPHSKFQSIMDSWPLKMTSRTSDLSKRQTIKCTVIIFYRSAILSGVPNQALHSDLSRFQPKDRSAILSGVPNQVLHSELSRFQPKDRSAILSGVPNQAPTVALPRREIHSEELQGLPLIGHRVTDQNPHKDVFLLDGQ